MLNHHSIQAWKKGGKGYASLVKVPYCDLTWFQISWQERLGGSSQLVMICYDYDPVQYELRHIKTRLYIHLSYIGDCGKNAYHVVAIHSSQRIFSLGVSRVCSYWFGLFRDGYTTVSWFPTMTRGRESYFASIVLPCPAQHCARLVLPQSLRTPKKISCWWQPIFINFPHHNIDLTIMGMAQTCFIP